MLAIEPYPLSGFMIPRRGDGVIVWRLIQKTGTPEHDVVDGTRHAVD